MTALLTALGSGVSAQKILNYLMKKAPNLAPRISQALASGLSAEKVVKFFAKGQNFEKLKAEMEQAYPINWNANPLVQAQATRSQNLGTDLASGLQRNIGPALGTAAALGTSYALSRAIPAILQGGQQLAGSQTPPSPGSPASPISPTQPIIPSGGVTPTATPAGIQTQTPLNQQTLQPLNVSPNIVQQPPQITQPQTIPSDLTDVLFKHTSKDQIDKLIKSGNGTEEITAFLKQFRPKDVKAIEKEAKKPLKVIVNEYVSKVQSQEKVSQKAEKEIQEHIGKSETVKPTDSTMPGFVPSEEDLREHAENPFLGSNMPGWKPKHLTHEEYLESLKNYEEAQKAIKKRNLGTASKAKETKEKEKKYKERMGPILEEHRQKQKAELEAQKEAIKGKTPAELDKLMDDALLDAAKEIEEGINAGQRYYTVTGGEWKAVGQSDVTEEGKEPYPKRGPAGAKENFLEVIEKYMPVQALYQRYRMFDPKLSSDKFFKRLEKSLIDLLT